MKPYPPVLTEDATLDAALSGKCIARYGDGELNLALGGDCVFQRRNAVLASELKKILVRPRPNLLVCIPNCAAPTKRAWRRYTEARYTDLYANLQYGSAFISRPDSAPWIDRADYWDRLKALWIGKDVTLVAGSTVSLTPDDLAGAKSVRVVVGPAEDAWEHVDVIDAAIGTPPGPVILCLGPTATVLAWRLSKRNVHAIDLGHVGLYLRHVGAYAQPPEAFATPGYVEQLRLLHHHQAWGHHGASHAPMVRAFMDKIGAKTVLDYGCGQATLQAALKPVKVQLYDPGVVHRDGLPKPADLIVCTDVLEHVEPECLEAVLRHIFLLADKGAYLSISCQRARETLPDGRNAHLIVQPPEWWMHRVFNSAPWDIDHVEKVKGIRIWLKKGKRDAGWLTK